MKDFIFIDDSLTRVESYISIIVEYNLLAKQADFLQSFECPFECVYVDQCVCHIWSPLTLTEPIKTNSKETNKFDKKTDKVSSKRDKSTVIKQINMDSKE